MLYGMTSIRGNGFAELWIARDRQTLISCGRVNDDCGNYARVGFDDISEIVAGQLTSPFYADVIDAERREVVGKSEILALSREIDGQ